MSYAKPLSFALLALFVAGLAQAKEDMKPGQWEYTTRMEMPGMPVAIPPTVIQQCLKAEDVAAGRTQPQQSDCEMKNLKTSGNTVSYDMECKGKTAATGHYEFTTTGTTMQGTGTMNVQGQSMTMHMSAKRLGDCK